jgi:hypothetical protein
VNYIGEKLSKKLEPLKKPESLHLSQNRLNLIKTK